MKDKTEIIDSLDEVWESLDVLLAGLSADEWARPSSLPGWDVKANVAHMIGTESALGGRSGPDSAEDVSVRDHVRNEVGVANERWVASMADAAPSEVLDSFRDITAQRLEFLRSLSQDEWEADAMTPVGPSTYGRFMQIRVFDCWMHEQDIRDGLDRPGHRSGASVEVTLDELQTALGYLVGKKAGFGDGQSVSIVLTGPTERTIDVLVDGRASVVDALPGPPTVMLTTDVHTLTRLAGGRSNAPSLVDRVAISGDEELGRRLVENMGYTI